MPSPDWPAPTALGPVRARVVLPGSKSLTNRYLVLAAIAGDVSRLRAPLRSRDTLLMAGALRSLGVGVEDVDDGDWLVTPAPLVGGGSVDCGLAGNVMRFVPPLAGLADGPVRFDGDEGARRRPMAPVLDALRGLGVEVDDEGRGGLPFTVHGRGSVRGGTVTIDASASSQFVSGLLLSAARFDEGVTVRHVGTAVPSLPHIEMTVETLRDAGVVVDDADRHTWRVEPSEVNALDVQVEPDLSNAAQFLAAALVTGGTRARPRVAAVHDAGRGLHPRRPRHDGRRGRPRPLGPHRLRRRRHPRRRRRPPRLQRAHSGRRGPHGARRRARASSAASPTSGATRPTGSRPCAPSSGSLGADVDETDDGLHVRPRPLHGTLFHTYADHRMVMAGAVLGLAVPGRRRRGRRHRRQDACPSSPTLWDRMLHERVTADA